MKETRPGVPLGAICLPEDADRLAAVMMKHTTTLGVRRQDMSRHALERAIETVETSFGPVRGKPPLAWACGAAKRNPTIWPLCGAKAGST